MAGSLSENCWSGAKVLKMLKVLKIREARGSRPSLVP